MKSNNSKDKYDLKRFLNTQSLYYKDALSEIKAGHKQTHWMWYIFPQLKILGYSDTAKQYGIASLDEAKAYVGNKTLHERLIEISQALLELETCDAESVFGWPDNLKLKSCMTLFEIADPECDVYGKVLEKFYGGEHCERTVEFIKLEL